MILSDMFISFLIRVKITVDPFQYFLAPQVTPFFVLKKKKKPTICSVLIQWLL